MTPDEKLDRILLDVAAINVNLTGLDQRITALELRVKDPQAGYGLQKVAGQASGSDILTLALTTAGTAIVAAAATDWYRGQ